MSGPAVCADIQQRLVLQLCQAQPHLCSKVTDGKNCYKMEFQVSGGTFCTASLSSVKARTAAAVRSWLGSGDGNDQGRQWLKHQPGFGGTSSLPPFCRGLDESLDVSVTHIWLSLGLAEPPALPFCSWSVR